MSDQNSHPILQWQAPEFRHYPKNIGWYITFIALSILIIGFFIIQKDYFGAASLTILACLIAFFSNQHPQTIIILIDQHGIQYGNLHFPYAQVKQFWIVDTEHHKTLNVETTALVNNTLILELVDENPQIIREVLLKHIPEHEDPKATLAQKISHRLKF